MSCNICHCPILVHPLFLDPEDPGTITQTDHLDPIVEQVCPREHQPYYRSVIQLDRRFEGIVVQNVQHFGLGLFGTSQFLNMGGMAMVMRQEEMLQDRTHNNYHLVHDGCLKLFCSEIGVPFDLSQTTGEGTMIALLERFEYLGTTVFGGYEGIDYSEGKMDERWLTQPHGKTHGNEFAWHFDYGKYDWTMKRPDMFPHLHPTIETGLDQIDIAEKTSPPNDWLSTTPSAVFLNIAKHLWLEDLHTFSTLNKHLRHRCLISESFQNIVRSHLDINSIPILEEYPHISEDFPHPAANGNWLLYSQHVKTHPSMRNRRRIINIISQLKSQYIKKATEAGYLVGPNSQRMQSYLRMLVEQQLLLRKICNMYDFELFLKAMTVLNKAYAVDIRRPKFMGKEMPVAMAAVKKLVEGKVPLPKQLPSAILDDRIFNKICERNDLIMVEKNRYSKPRGPDGL